MPHLYSPAALLARRARAAALGFLKPVHAGYRLLEIETPFLPAVAAGYRSLRFHRDHDRSAGAISHHGRLASLAAFRAGAITKEACTEAARAHRDAGRAKHGISKVSALQTLYEPDPLHRDDPWRLATLPVIVTPAAVLDLWRFFQVPKSTVHGGLSHRIATLETEVAALKATILKLDRLVATVVLPLTNATAV